MKFLFDILLVYAIFRQWFFNNLLIKLERREMVKRQEVVMVACNNQVIARTLGNYLRKKTDSNLIQATVDSAGLSEMLRQFEAGKKISCLVVYSLKANLNNWFFLSIINNWQLSEIPLVLINKIGKKQRRVWQIEIIVKGFHLSAISRFKKPLLDRVKLLQEMSRLCSDVIDMDYFLQGKNINEKISEIYLN